MVKDVATVEDECRLLHRLVDARVVVGLRGAKGAKGDLAVGSGGRGGAGARLELVPFGEDGDGMCTSARNVRVVLDHDLLHRVFAQVGVDLLARHLRVINRERRLLLQQRFAHVDRRRLARVARVLFKCEAQDRDLLSADRVEHR